MRFMMVEVLLKSSAKKTQKGAFSFPLH